MNNITIQLPDDTHNALHQRANATGEPPSALASTLLRQALEEPNTTPQPAPTRQLPPTPKAPIGPPPWLPPPNDPDWYPQMWDAILTLRQRYTAMLLRLERNWWIRADRAETLGGAQPSTPKPKTPAKSSPSKAPSSTSKPSSTTHAAPSITPRPTTPRHPSGAGAQTGGKPRGRDDAYTRKSAS